MKDLTALHLAAKFDSGKVTYLLISSEAGVNLKDVEGRTPLHWAAQFDSLTVAELLLENGASVDSKDRLKKTPLHVAAEFKSSRVARHGHSCSLYLRLLYKIDKRHPGQLCLP